MLDFIHSHGMIISGMILLISYIFIASEKIQKSVVALVGASLTMLLGLIPLTLNLDSNVKGVFEYVDFEYKEKISIGDPQAFYQELVSYDRPPRFRYGPENLVV